MLLSILLSFELALNFSQLSFGFHSVVNDNDELLLIPVLDDINLGPGLIFDLLTFLLVDPHQLFDLLLQLLTLFVLLILLQRMLDLQLFVLLLLEQVELGNLLAEAFLLLLLLVEQLLVSFVVGVHFLFMFALLDFELFSVQASQVLNFLVASQLDLILFVLNETVLLIVLRLLLANLGV